MIETLFIAIGLAMDSFAVSIALGSKAHRAKGRLAFTTAIYFGFFQGAMPVIGDQVGQQSTIYISQYTPIIAFVLLGFIGLKMIYESIKQNENKSAQDVTHRLLLSLAIATSIDAMAAGFSFTLLEVSTTVACITIGLVTFLLSYVGIYIGKRGNIWLESKAELIGGFILILIGLKVLVW